MKLWKGRWIIAISLLHAAFALMSFGAQYREILARGLAGAADTTEAKLAVWFFLVGVLFWAVGQLVLAIERAGQAVPVSAAVPLLLLTLLGVVLMPKSGAWFLFPPVIGLFVERGPESAGREVARP